MDSAVVDRLAQHARIKRRVWGLSVWSWVVGFLLFFVGFVFLAHFVPPPAPTLTAQQANEFLSTNLMQTRIGLVMALAGSGFLLPFYTVVSAEIRKIEGRPAVLAPMQMGGAVVLVAFFQIIAIGWLLATFRPDRNPEITQMLLDYGWLVWTMMIVPYEFQFICMAVASFMDVRERPAFPRWVGYTFIWVAIVGPGGEFTVIFKTGPAAWTGVIGFWVPTVVYAIGMFVASWALYRHARYERSRGGVESVDDLYLRAASAASIAA